jgi:hypothetical protein
LSKNELVLFYVWQKIPSPFLWLIMNDSLVDQTTMNTMSSSTMQHDGDDVTTGIYLSVVSRYRPPGVAGAAGSSPWLWAPHVAIGALLVALMMASFVRFHCKYGHKYRTGSQSLSPTGFRSGPKNAWMPDKKGSSTTRLPSSSGAIIIGPSVGMSMAAGVGGRPGAGRSAAVIVLRPVGEAAAATSGLRCQPPLSRRSADPVLLGASSRHESVVDLFPEVVYTTTTSAGSSNISVDTAHVQQAGERITGKLSAIGADVAEVGRKADVSLTPNSLWNIGSRMTSANGNDGQLDVASTKHTTMTSPMDDTNMTATTNAKNKETSLQQKCQYHQQEDLFSPECFPTNSAARSVPMTSATVGNRSNHSSAFSAAATAPVGGGVGLLAPPGGFSPSSEWSWPSAVPLTASAAASSVRGTLLRLQPTIVSPSGGESDTERLLLLDDCDDRLLVL